MSHYRQELRESFRALQLPILLDKEEACLDAVEKSLEAAGIVGDDVPLWLNLRHSQWREDGVIPKDFSSIITTALSTGHPEFGQNIADAYFKLHRELQDDFFLSKNKATAFLSHSLLMIRLAREEQMSSAQIARMLISRDQKADFSRQAVDAALKKFRAKAALDQEKVEALFQQDNLLDDISFADSDLNSAAEIVGNVAERLGVETPYADCLKIMYASDTGEPLTPYIQIIHYQCIVVEFFDHSPMDLYEFNPRGRIAEWLFDQYPDALVSASNPFLNNAKSVERIDPAWVRSKKKGERPGANALFLILHSLDTLGFAARQELASWTRRWIHRLFKYTGDVTVEIPTLTAENIKALLANLSKRETNTLGIIEQRIVDAVTRSGHGADWIPRGLRDSVNSTNISQRKLGDVDYQNVNERAVIAYEAHAGKLTKVYLDGHLRTLAKAMALRQEEWALFSDPQAWKAKLVFIAHEFEVQEDIVVNICGINIDVEMVTYHDFLKGVVAEDVADFVTEYVTAQLNQRRTPLWVREIALKLL